MLIHSLIFVFNFSSDQQFLNELGKAFNLLGIIELTICEFLHKFFDYTNGEYFFILNNASNLKFAAQLRLLICLFLSELVIYCYN